MAEYEPSIENEIKRRAIRDPRGRGSASLADDGSSQSAPTEPEVYSEFGDTRAKELGTDGRG